MPQDNIPSCPYKCSESKTIESIKTTVDRIDRALQGDEYHPNGLVAKREKDHKRIVRIERFIWTVSGGFTVGFAIFKLFVQ
jgi:hypothetical protein